MSEIGDAAAAYSATRVLPKFAPGMDGTRIRKVATELSNFVEVRFGVGETVS